jgi:hypothetical protein
MLNKHFHLGVARIEGLGTISENSLCGITNRIEHVDKHISNYKLSKNAVFVVIYAMDERIK